MSFAVGRLETEQRLSGGRTAAALSARALDSVGGTAGGRARAPRSRVARALAAPIAARLALPRLLGARTFFPRSSSMGRLQKSICHVAPSCSCGASLLRSGRCCSGASTPAADTHRAPPTSRAAPPAPPRLDTAASVAARPAPPAARDPACRRSGRPRRLEGGFAGAGAPTRAARARPHAIAGHPALTPRRHLCVQPIGGARGACKESRGLGVART